MMKYQFCIRFNNIDANSAASKAVLDCNAILSEKGYRDLTFTVGDNSNKLKYYILLLKQLIRFYLEIKPASVVAVQYPLLSINNIFKHFIKLLKRKNVNFFCVIHDLESLRNGGSNQALIKAETTNLNSFDAIIVHNNAMGNWLRLNGLKVNIIELGIFDYLVSNPNAPHHKKEDDVAFAGNLTKSIFIYKLNNIQPLNFKIYGPGLRKDKLLPINAYWVGEFGPNEVAKVMSGSFGLLWDGSSTDQLDALLGNYLRYNNPHKFSLYIAAGLPVIAPRDSAIASAITNYKVGILVDHLQQLNNIDVSDAEYKDMLTNVAALRKRVIAGDFFSSAVTTAEKQLLIQK